MTVNQRAYIVDGRRGGEGIFPKDPGSVEDFTIVWNVIGQKHEGLNYLGDSIVTSLWSVPAGITQDSATFSGTYTTIWLSGGTNGQSYEVTNTITTEQGRTFKQSIRIRVKSR